jgi:protein-S-isoprenylcysteine O-methyltransferase Ste14
MAHEPDRSNAIIRPPIALLIAFGLGLAFDWLYPLPFVPASIPRVLTGGAVFAAGLALAIWAIVTIRRAGTEVETTKPTTAIVSGGPFRFTRNPIYSGMLLGLAGLAVGFDTLWILGTLILFYLVIRYGVIAREEAYLERKFGDAYLGYKSQVRRWL